MAISWLLGGWTRWTKDAPHDVIYMFEVQTGKLVQIITGLPAGPRSLAFSPDSRYLAAGLSGASLRIFARDKKWAEVFRDTDYGDDIYGVAFAADGRFATTSRDGMVRLYDSGFKLVAPPKNGSSGNVPVGIAFNPGGAELAVGYYDVTAVDLFDGQSLAPLQGVNLDGLAGTKLLRVAWSANGPRPICRRP